MRRFNSASIVVLGALASAGSAYGIDSVSTTAGVTPSQMNGASDVPDSEAVARENWRTLMAQNPASEEGCFHASYPNIVWEKVDCRVAVPPRFHTTPVRPPDGAAAQTGNGHDYVAQAQGLITWTLGAFYATGVKSEHGVGGSGGILGPNEYELQINTNAFETTSACDKHSGCTVWQQFLYSPDYYYEGEAAVFMQYWLLNWGSSACPGGWRTFGADCYRNSTYYAVAPDIPITDLNDVSLSGRATAGGNDVVTLDFGSEAYSISGKDDVLNIASVWNKAEFNVVGNNGGSEAVFNSGSSISAVLMLTDGSASAPKCVANEGTTGETNNLNLGKCTAAVELFPEIYFTESN
jgi:hypothetical protein